MQAISPSDTTGDGMTLFTRMATDDQRTRIYLDRASFGFRGALTDQEYAQKQQILDKYAGSTQKTVYALVATDDPDGEYYATLEVHLRDMYWRRSRDSATECGTAAHFACIFVPPRHRSHGYARQILQNVSGILRASREVALICGSATAGMESLYGAAVQWHAFRFADWAVQDFKPKVSLLPTEPIYAHDLGEIIPIGSARTKAAVSTSRERGAVFAFKLTESYARVRLAHYRMCVP